MSSRGRPRKRVTPTPPNVSSPRWISKKKPPTPSSSSSSSSSDDSDSDNDILEVITVPRSSSPATKVTDDSKAKMNSRQSSPTKPSSPSRRRLAPALEQAKTPTKAPVEESEEDEDESDSEEDDLDENDLTPTLSSLSCLCWKCQVTLKIPQSPTKRNPQEFCMYAMHVHPLLKTPVCSVCVNELANCPENDEVCHGCADYGDLFLCDKCESPFCKTCVEQAYGGGKVGRKAVRKMENDDGEWFCPVCDPPSGLQALQEELESNAPASLDVEGGNDTSKRSMDDIIEELFMVEKEKQACQELCDNPDAVQAKRDEIACEIRAEKPKLSEKKLDALVNDEMQVWQDMCTKHDARLGDMVASLQEELEVGYEVDLAKLYQKHLGYGEQKTEGEVEPEWKRTADLEIYERIKSHPQTTLRNVFDQEIYESEFYNDVEDLMTRPEDERECPGSGFRSTQERPSAKQIQEAFDQEDKYLAERNLKILIRVDNAADERETNNEEQETSQQGAGGVSRVRRDTMVGLNILNIRRKKGPLKPKPASMPTIAEGTLSVANDPVETRGEQSEPKVGKAIPPPVAVANQGFVDLTDDTPVAKFPATKPAASQHVVKKALNFEKTNHCTIVTREEESKEGVAETEDIDEDEYYCPSDPHYKNSDLVLSSPETFRSTSGKRVKTICATTELTQHLKSHQREGALFLWQNACVDFNVRTSRDEEVHEEKQAGGCILAHSMGLGKSLTSIAVMYTMLTHPGMRCKNGKGLVHTILLVLPVNTIASWKVEFEKWTSRLQPSVLVYDFAEHQSASRPMVVGSWLDKGGVMLISKDSFQKAVSKIPELQNPGPDALFIDEAHQCLANRGNAIYKALEGVKTKRRLLLTGTPFQNNALEYYRMVHFMRKGVLDDSEAAFDKEFARPIAAGMPSDASKAAVTDCALKSVQLKSILEKYVHRKDSSVLRESLPPMQQVIMHLRPTRTQTLLYNELKRHESRNGVTNFLHRYHLARPLHNHPACLQMQSQSDDPDESAAEKDQDNRPWWSKFFEKKGQDKVTAVNQGSKVVILLHILAHAIEIGDKVVLFSQCLKTLDFIEEVLQKENWFSHVKSLKQEFPHLKLGGWQRNKEYLRIDGATESKARGLSVERFNRVETTPSERVQLFLISSKAGGVGITLTAANRVILFDSHFNPCVTEQALHRCYRFGQTKSTFVYRFLIDGTGEEKIYTRSVNKSGLALRVVDGKNFKGSFTEQELSNMVLNDTWVQCERCEQWRMLKGEEEDLPDKWYCEMNKNDTVNNSCKAPEKDAKWYHAHFQLQTVDLGNVGATSAGTAAAQHQYIIIPNEGTDSNEPALDPNDCAHKDALKRKDVILTKLLDDTSVTKNKTIQKPFQIISKWYFHDALLDATEDLADEIPEVDSSESSSADVREQNVSESRDASRLRGSETIAVPEGDFKPAAKKNKAAASESVLEPINREQQNTAESEIAVDSGRESISKRSIEVLPSHRTPQPEKKLRHTESGFTITRIKRSKGSSARKAEPHSEPNRAASRVISIATKKGASDAAKAYPASPYDSKSSAKWQSPRARMETKSNGSAALSSKAGDKRRTEDDSNSGKIGRRRRLDLDSSGVATSEVSSGRNGRQSRPPPPKKHVIELLSESDSADED